MTQSSIDKTSDLWRECKAIASEGIGRSSDGRIQNKAQKIEAFAEELYRKKSVITLTVPSIYEQNGCKRLHKDGLRLMVDLENVHQHDYDIELPAFKEYLTKRGIPYKVPAIGLTNSNVIYHYKAKLQDAWEIFIGHVDVIEEDLPKNRVFEIDTTATRKQALLATIYTRI